MQFFCELREIQVSSPGESDLLMKTTNERLTRDLQHDTSKFGQEWIFIGRLKMMQLDVDLHKTDSIVGC